MSDKSRLKISYVVLAGVAMVLGVWLGSQQDQATPRHQAEKIQGVILPVAKTLRPFQLRDHHDQLFTEARIKGHWSLVFVGYTQCPDVCPAALSVLKQVHLLMTEQHLLVPQVVFLSIDPERDSLRQLSDYVKYFNTEFLGVTGSIEQLKIMTQQLSVSFAKAPGAEGKMDKENYLMDHSSSFLLINPEGKLQSFLTAPHHTESIVASIKSSQKFYKNNL